MKSIRQKIAMSMAVMALLCIDWSCTKDNGSSTTPPATPKNNVRLSTTTKFGSILTDSAGNSLYFFSIDAHDSSGCNGNCIVAWPAFYKASLTLDSGLNKNDFATTTRRDGSPQTTYKGWPLYYYQNDIKAGDINGDGVGKVWFVAKPDYTVMLSNTQLIGNNGLQYDSLFQPGPGITQYMTDAYGHTLYSFSPDHFRKNNFTKADFSNNPSWPIDTLLKVGHVPSTLDKTQFDTLTVFGKVQLVYKGWPLYYFGNDKGVRGSTKGVSVPTPGFWPYVNVNSSVAPQ
jgi:predicted lipoprotein with Yx(FWY)xxD motif